MIVPGNDNLIRVWGGDAGSAANTPGGGHTGSVLTVTVGRVVDRDIVVSGGSDGTIRRWDAASGQPIGDPMTGHPGWVRAVAMGRVGDRDVIVSAGHDRTLRVGDGTAGTTLSIMDTTEHVVSVAIHNDAIIVAAAGAMESITLAG
jgi:WD40 repeat protein